MTDSTCNNFFKKKNPEICPPLGRSSPVLQEWAGGGIRRKVGRRGRRQAEGCLTPGNTQGVEGPAFQPPALHRALLPQRCSDWVVPGKSVVIQYLGQNYNFLNNPCGPGTYGSYLTRTDIHCEQRFLTSVLPSVLWWPLWIPKQW